MEGGDVFIEIDREKIQSAHTSADRGRVVSQNIVEICRSLRCDRANLLVAASIPGYE